MYFRANIRRPISLSSDQFRFALGESELFDVSFPRELEGGIPPESILLTCSEKSLTVILAKSEKNPNAYEVHLRGQRSSALEFKSAAVRIKYNGSDWNIDDIVATEFFDGTMVRVYPANPSERDGEIRFHLLRAGGLKSSEIKISCNGNEIKEFKAIQSNPSLVSIVIPSSIVSDSIHIEGDRFHLSIPFSPTGNSRGDKK